MGVLVEQQNEEDEVGVSRDFMLERIRDKLDQIDNI